MRAVQRTRSIRGMFLQTGGHAPSAQLVTRYGSLPTPLVVIRSTAVPSSTWDGWSAAPPRTANGQRSQPPYPDPLDLFSFRGPLRGHASLSGPLRHHPVQRQSQADDEGMISDDAEKQEEAIEVLSNRSDETFHTATRSPALDADSGVNGGSQSLQLLRLQQAVDLRTGSVKKEESIRDRLPRLQHSNLAGGILGDDSEDDTRSSPVDLSKETADRLVTIYLNRDLVTLPILNPQDFRSAYETASAAGASPPPSAFHATLNTVFALSCLSVDSMGKGKATDFFKEGQRLAKLVDHHRSIDLIRLYLLQVQYLNAIGDLHTAWALIGTAIRVAQSLRLPFHAKQHENGRKDRETARRLWHGAMIMERILALQLGIAPQTSDALRVPLPTHLDTDYVDLIWGGQQNAQAERASVVEFFTACARLYALVDDIMAWEEEVRIRPNSCAMKKLLSLDFKLFLKADSMLHDWNLSLPSSLQTGRSHSPDDHPIVVRQRNILRARYLYLRLRLDRPLVTLGLTLSTKCTCKPDGQPHITERRLSPDAPVALGLVHGASIKCARAALELTELIRANEAGLLSLNAPLNIHHGPLPPHWEIVDYLYVCGTIFLATFNHQCPFFGAMTDEEDEQCRVLWSRMLDLLARYAEHRPTGRAKNTAQACRSTLSDLHDAVVDGAEGTGWTGDAAVLGPDTRNRVFGRIELESPARQRWASGASSADLARRAPEFPVWMESLPVDLAE
ncbi:transcription factor domain-containing protein [Aspergillus clavatus NRRL 1]|uniref:Fungal specific transcription factor domain protein n=1 Tax=Aspergillus clavatus (strain ATCC 1007 / CBS 513.65 / DSM 816 / NCTC 3887 / NRRL 1 / QM 1276 / 107) TaxID=344612 RepID=A1CPX7_ASPCL|nr:fungal specific transcription factor domain protein [Aspergillus clavatus NRRL 1]EAW07698.1 fungal specific transcription factor domain protein [Aspergillus clavatus NRRL 1]